MDQGTPSRTAYVTAVARAHHQYANEPRILDDPFAARIVGLTEPELAQLNVDWDGQTGNSRDINQSRRLFLASRARFAEDSFHDCGARQVVILGAGLDTFAYRHPTARVFEVDHPATQSWKRDLLSSAEIEEPSSLTFVPVDFERQSLADELHTAGFDRSDAAIFVWLGVTMYLSQSAIDDTLSYISSCDHADLVLDYLQPGQDTDQRSQRVAAVGEPWLSYFTPETIAAALAAHGFAIVDDLAVNDLIRRYAGADYAMSATPPHVIRAVTV